MQSDDGSTHPALGRELTLRAISKRKGLFGTKLVQVSKSYRDARAECLCL